VVLDASILVKLAVREPGSDQVEEAILAIPDESELIVVETSYAECLNARWKKTTLSKELSVAQMREALSILAGYFDRVSVTPTRDIAEEALSIGIKNRLPVYDSLYIADASRRGGVLYTADKEMHEVAARLVESRLIGVD